MRPGRLFGKIASLIFIVISTAVKAQNVTITEVNAPLDSAFKKVRDQTGYGFIYTDKLLKKANPITATFNNIPLTDALTQLFLKQPLDYTINNKMVILREKDTNPIVKETYTISGIINDEKGQSIPGATVFLTNTKDVTVTDNAGKFILNDLTPGPYEMVVKMLGFTPDIRPVKIENKNIAINITLKEAIINLNTVDIKEKPDRNRKKYIHLFTENFIGKSTNADQCKLLNPDVLTFYYNETEDILNVYANDFLIIENDALGYRIKYLLKKFNCHPYYGSCDYEGYPYFEELNGDEAQKKQWEINRRASYLGSNRHFFRSVINNTAAAEGFAMYQFEDYGVVKKDFNSVFQDIDHAKIFVSKFPSSNKKIVRERLYIIYKRAKESSLFKRTGVPLEVVIDSSRFYQFSMMGIFADTIKINKETLLNPFVNLSFSGYWAWERVAEYLPLDYFVAPLAEKK